MRMTGSREATAKVSARAGKSDPAGKIALIVRERNEGVKHPKLDSNPQRILGYGTILMI
jgi:hypothetical protein